MVETERILADSDGGGSGTRHFAVGYFLLTRVDTVITLLIRDSSRDSRGIIGMDYYLHNKIVIESVSARLRQGG